MFDLAGGPRGTEGGGGEKEGRGEDSFSILERLLEGKVLIG